MPSNASASAPALVGACFVAKQDLLAVSPRGWVYDRFVFKLFKRREGRTVGLARIADARMQLESMGRLPSDVAAGGSEQEPAPEYIAEAATPSEDVWEREQARFRAQNGADLGT